MNEIDSVLFTYQEVVECLIKSKNIHRGLWGLRIGFGLGATNISTGEDDSFAPAAIVPVTEIGIQKFAKANNLTVDAALVNPAPKPRSKNKNPRSVVREADSSNK